jgi:hypothetical protein
MLERVQTSPNNANIVVNLYTEGINVTMAATTPGSEQLGCRWSDICSRSWSWLVSPLASLPDHLIFSPITRPVLSFAIHKDWIWMCCSEVSHQFVGPLGRTRNLRRCKMILAKVTFVYCRGPKVCDISVPSELLTFCRLSLSCIYRYQAKFLITGTMTLDTIALETCCRIGGAEKIIVAQGSEPAIEEGRPERQQV